MRKPMLCLVLPLEKDDDARPEHPIAKPPVGGGAGEHPSHPIELPPGIWPSPPGMGGGEVPSHPIYIPDLKPEHPIVLPPAGGGERPDNTLPGAQPKPPSGGERPDNTLPGAQPKPSHPISGGWALIYSPSHGGWILISSGGDSESGSGTPGSGNRPDNTLPGAQPKK